MRLLKDFFDDIEDVNVAEETVENKSRFRCTVSLFDDSYKTSYVKNCIENMS